MGRYSYFCNVGTRKGFLHLSRLPVQGNQTGKMDYPAEYTCPEPRRTTFFARASDSPNRRASEPAEAGCGRVGKAVPQAANLVASVPATPISSGSCEPTPLRSNELRRQVTTPTSSWSGPDATSPTYGTASALVTYLRITSKTPPKISPAPSKTAGVRVSPATKTPIRIATRGVMKAISDTTVRRILLTSQ